MISIRELHETDIPNIQKYISEPSLSKMSYISFPYPENGAKSWFRILTKLINQERAKAFVIELNSSFAGVITFNELCFLKQRTNIDYWVRVDCQERGVASKAISLASEEARKMGLITLYSGCLSRNFASQKALLNNGFSPYQEVVLGDGKYKGEKQVHLLRRLI